ncbi:MAG: hypothetical protein JW969_08855 [Spirochaetales bacterium]|nr:hypothetical protein [Spirochaetales bacterium]
METGRKLKIIILITILFPLCITSGANVNIKLGNNATWTVTIDSVTSPGMDVTNEYYSGDTAYYFTTINTNKTNWRIDMDRTTGSWNGSIRLSVIRLTDGTGAGSVTGGDTTYVLIDGTTREFFHGDQDRADVYFRYRIDQVTASVLNYTTYSTTITFTGVDN